MARPTPTKAAPSKPASPPPARAEGQSPAPPTPFQSEGRAGGRDSPAQSPLVLLEATPAPSPGGVIKVAHPSPLGLLQAPGEADEVSEIMSLAGSPEWAEREAALKRLAVLCSGDSPAVYSRAEAGELWDRAMAVLGPLLKDKVTPVYLAALVALEAATARCAGQVALARAREDLARAALPTLLHRVGNVHARIRAETVAVLASLSGLVGAAFVAGHLLQPVPEGKGRAPHLTGRAEAMLAVLKAAPGRGQGDEVAEVRPRVVGMAREGLLGGDDKLRKAAGRVAVTLYRQARRGGESFDVAAVTGGLNPALARALHRHMRAVDEELGLPALAPAETAPEFKSALPGDRPRALPVPGAGGEGGAALPPRRPGALQPLGRPAPRPGAVNVGEWVGGPDAGPGSPGGTACGELGAGWGADQTGPLPSSTLPRVLDDTDEALMDAILAGQ